MKKVIIQGLITLLLFTAVFLGLRQLDWMKVLKVEKIKNKTEEKLGEEVMKAVLENSNEIPYPEVINPLDSILDVICEKNGIDRDKIKLHVIDKNIINAISLPGGHLVVFSGIINETKNQNELIGVMSHEIAHIQSNHVMKKLVSEIGLTAITLSSGGGEAARQALKMLSSSAYSRNMEKEADLKAVDYMVNAKVDPEGMANFMYKIDSESESEMNFDWLATHPGSKERAEYILSYSKGKLKDPKEILSSATWNILKKKLKNSDAE